MIEIDLHVYEINGWNHVDDLPSNLIELRSGKYSYSISEYLHETSARWQIRSIHDRLTSERREITMTSRISNSVSIARWVNSTVMRRSQMISFSSCDVIQSGGLRRSRSEYDVFYHWGRSARRCRIEVLIT